MKDWDEMSDSEKEILAVAAIGNLVEMLDGKNDMYKQILLEEIFKFVFESKSEDL